MEWPEQKGSLADSRLSIAYVLMGNQSMPESLFCLTLSMITATGLRRRVSDAVLL